MFGKLSGKKTYILAALSILGAIAGYLTGDMQLDKAIDLIVTAGLAATVRNGIK